MTALDLRPLLLALACDPPDLTALGPLADALEDMGDARADDVRLALHQPWACEAGWSVSLGTPGNPSAYHDRGEAACELARLVLTLFPEGPRWYALDDGTPHLTRADATSEARPFSCTSATRDELMASPLVRGPIWPTPPA